MSVVSIALLSPVLADGGLGSLMPLLIVVFFVISIIRALKQAHRAKQEHQATQDESDDDRRAREIRERLRRIVAERSGQGAPLGAPEPSPTFSPPPLEQAEPLRPPRPLRTPPLEPFGGPMRRVVEEWERRLKPSAPVPPLVVARVEPEPSPSYFEREPQPLALPPEVVRPTHAVVDAMAISDQGAAKRAAERQELLNDLRDPQSLRRAFVLREVLGPPVALR